MSIKYVPTVNYDDIPGELPDSSLPKDADFASLAQAAIESLNDLHKEHLAINVIWRDLLSFTDTYRTFYSVDTVYDTLRALSQKLKRSDFKLNDTAPRLSVCGASRWLDIDISFTTQVGTLTSKCAGTVSVSPDSSGQLEIWMLRTWLEHFEGHGNPDQLELPSASGHTEAIPNGNTNGDHKNIYDCIIVGGGQGGLGLAGRLKALRMSYILFDNRPEIGDSWSHRYDSLKWHTIKQYGNLPFGRTFPEEDENLLPAKRIGAGYHAWSKKYDINAQTGTNVDSVIWDEASQTWAVRTSGARGREEWMSKNLVLCIGPAAKSPVSPEWATPEKIQASGFKGTLVHGSQYRNVEKFAGLRGVVIGTANTAHDVAEDMVIAGMDTTMVQRNPTFIFPGEWLVGYHSHDYHLDKDTEVADREQATLPYKIQREMANRILHGLIKAYPEKFDALEKAGFKVDRPGDLYTNLYIRAGGHYVDIGNCARIINGDVKIKAQQVRELTANGLRFEDGSELEVDLLVLCTGFEHDFSKDAAQIVGKEIAEQMETFWGMDAEGELQGFAKLAGHPHLYYHGSEARLARFYSRFVALQMQKEKLGQSLEPYREVK